MKEVFKIFHYLIQIQNKNKKIIIKVLKNLKIIYKAQEITIKKKYN